MFFEGVEAEYKNTCDFHDQCDYNGTCEATFFGHKTCSCGSKRGGTDCRYSKMINFF